MKTYCFALDLHDNPDLIEEYKRYHRQENIWPEVLECIRAKGVVSQRIYLAGNRMVTIHGSRITVHGSRFTIHCPCAPIFRRGGH